MYISIGLSKKELLPLLASNKMYIPQSITQLIDIVSPISNYIFSFWAGNSCERTISGPHG